MTGPSESRAAASVAAAQAQLQEVDDRVTRHAQRSRRFSTFAWAFLFAVALGDAALSLIDLYVSVVTTTTGAAGTSTSSMPPEWGPFVAFAPAVALLGLAVREVVLGRRGTPARRRGIGPADAPAAEETTPWIESIRRAQELLARAGRDAEWSFVPLALGLLSLGQIIAGVAGAYALAASLPVAFLAVAGAAAVASLAVLWPLYRGAKQWLEADQALLERESRELGELEAEFFWRFVGTGPTP